MRIKAIALNTLKEAIRDKVFYNLLIFATLVIIAAVLIGDLSIGANEKIIKDIGLAAILFFGMLTAIFVGIGLVSKEIERRTLYTLLAKPVHRYEFLLGKYLGLCLTLLVNTLVMTVFLFLVVKWQNGPLNTSTLIAILLIYCELVLITAIALLFSTLSGPTLSAVFTFALYIIGHLTTDLKDIGGATKSQFSRSIIDLCYYILPNFNNFNIRAEVVHGVHVSGSFILSVILYCVLYVAIVLCLSIVSFQRKEFY
jgi:ABC-type transport system involved in multi-copper enzyme maturation permease subunit